MYRELLAPLALLLLSAASSPADAPAADDGLPVTLASFATPLDSDHWMRVANIERAAERLDGACILPGETLSFDAAVGPRRLGDGYLPAPAILDGELGVAPAGGVCQLSSTLYNAALLAGLDIVERHPHTRPSAYVPPGRDATVARFHKDLRIRNASPQPVEIRAYVTGNHLIVSLQGERPLAVVVSLWSEPISTTPLEVAIYRSFERIGAPPRQELVSMDTYR